MGRVPFDVYTMDRLEWFRQEEQKKYKKQLAEERTSSILTFIRAFQRNGFSVENIVKVLMESFQLTHDEANSYMEKSIGCQG